MIHILLILGGIAIGWLTKIPWFWKYYNEYKRENQEIRAMIDRIPEVFRKLEEEKMPKLIPPHPWKALLAISQSHKRMHTSNTAKLKHFLLKITHSKYYCNKDRKR